MDGVRMEFCFVDNNNPLDKHSQKLIRSHAMKGKNLGKTICARGRRGRQRQHEKESISRKLEIESEGLPPVQSGRKLLPKVSKPGSSDSMEQHQDAVWLRNCFYGSELLYFVRTGPLTLSSRYLIHELYHVVTPMLYPPSFCRDLEEVKHPWFEMMIDNPCVFHCALAMAGAQISRNLGHREASLESTRHFVEATRLLRRELCAKRELQDSSLLVIVSLACNAAIVKNADECRIHLRGLKKIIESRTGGLAGICARFPEVGNKIRRADLDLALMVGSSSLFRSKYTPLPATLHAIASNANKPEIDIPHPLDKTSLEFQAIVKDVLTLCAYAGCTELEAFQYQDIILSIFQRLVDFSPLNGPRPPQVLDDVCQLGLLAFMNTVVHHNWHGGSGCSSLLSQTLQARISVFNHEKELQEAQNYFSFCLWLAFIYAVSAADFEPIGDARSFIARSILVLANKLALKTWEDARFHLIRYPWIGEFHDERAKNIWESIACS